MEAYERLLRYVRVWTTSDESSTATPSTERQSDLARMLEAEMKESIAMYMERFRRHRDMKTGRGSVLLPIWTRRRISAGKA